MNRLRTHCLECGLASRTSDPEISFAVLEQSVNSAVSAKLIFFGERNAFPVDAQKPARRTHPHIRVTIAQEAQNLDITEKRRQFEPTKAVAIPAIQACVGADPQLFTDRQQRIDLSVGQSRVDVGSSPARKKKEAIAECPQPNLAIGCFGHGDYWGGRGSQFLNVVCRETESALHDVGNEYSAVLVF